MSSQPNPPPGLWLKIALLSPIRKYFAYSCPLGLHPPHVGARVQIPFGKSQRVGIIVAIDESPEISPERIKPILEVVDAASLFSQELWQLLLWASDYYQWPFGDVVAAALPTALRKGEATVWPTEIFWRYATLTATTANLKNYRRQKETLAFFQQEPSRFFSEPELKNAGLTKASMRSLLEKGYLETETRPRLARSTVNIQGYSESEIPLELNPTQKIACEAIIQAFGQFQAFLLDGITGSGKTEVYLQAIQAILAQGKQALILVPEIGLTPQAVARFQARFPIPIAVLHSGLTDGERLTAWLMARDGLANIVIGTRSAAFVPLPRLGLCIIDEEHDASFKQQEGFRYSARDLLLKRCQLEKLPIVLGSATPALETLHNTLTLRYRHLKLPLRAGEAMLPSLQILDIRHKKLEEGLSSQLFAHIEQHLKEDSQVLLFLNRRGFAPLLYCSSCQWKASCKYCDAHLIHHFNPPHLRCHHCERTHALPTSCPQCRAATLCPLGMGTERVEQVLIRRFPDKKILRFDKDSTKAKGKISDLLRDVANGKADILLGTQMIAKGHHFPKVTLVAILDIDHAFFSQDFRSLERVGQLILQVAGRAGRAEKKGHVLIQSAQPEHPLLQCLLQEGYISFAQRLLTERQKALLPPFTYQTLVRSEAPSSSQALSFLAEIKVQLQALPFADLQILGPAPSPMEKRGNRFRGQLLLQAPKRVTLNLAIKKLLPFLDKISQSSQLRWSLDIDPLDMF